MEYVIGIAIGMALVVVFFIFRRPAASSDAHMETLFGRIKDALSALTLDAMSKNTTEFLKLANENLSRHLAMGEKELEGKKQLIDQTLDAMKEELKKVQVLVCDFEKDREQKFGELTNTLKTTAEQNMKLQETANKLRSALVSTTARGQWGQRMAEDILKLAGFMEGINYLKEKAQDTVTTRPDYTFLLPQDLKVNMDVKFPLDNYLRYTEEENETERRRYKEQFLRDARTRIREVTSRDYINPEEKTLDYVIVFIPNEQVYAFINDNDRSLLDDALRMKVIVVSPLTLYAILAVIRQAVDNFNLEKTASQILALLGTFNRQWENFIKSFDKLGRKIQEAQEEYNALTSTRRTQLERPIRKIEDLRKQKGIREEEALPDAEDPISIDS